MAEVEKRCFLGWKNLRWFIIELIKLGSNKPSYFSQKRFHEGFAFGILQWGMIHWLIMNIQKMPASELLIWSSVELLILGYTRNKIEEAKKNLLSPSGI